MPTATPRFRLGQTLATPGVLEALDRAGEKPDALGPYLARHMCGDWGDLDDHDRAANEHAVPAGERILSAYRLGDGTRVWIITEWDRSATTVLLPEEY